MIFFFQTKSNNWQYELMQAYKKITENEPVMRWEQMFWAQQSLKYIYFLRFWGLSDLHGPTSEACHPFSPFSLLTAPHSLVSLAPRWGEGALNFTVYATDKDVKQH